MKWQLISICFVHSWKTGLVAIWIANLLSQSIGTGVVCRTTNSVSKLETHTTSVTVEARLLYSASVELLKMVDCFFDFQERMESRNLRRYPLIESIIGTSCPISIRVGSKMRTTRSRHENTKTC